MPWHPLGVMLKRHGGRASWSISSQRKARTSPSSPAAASGGIVPGLREARRRLDAREQLIASNDILVALSRAGAHPEEVLVTIVERSRLLCGAAGGLLYLLEGDHLRLSRTSGDVPDEFRADVAEHPIAMDRSSSTGRAAVDRRTQ